MARRSYFGIVLDTIGKDHAWLQAQLKMSDRSYDNLISGKEKMSIKLLEELVQIFHVEPDFWNHLEYENNMLEASRGKYY